MRVLMALADTGFGHRSVAAAIANELEARGSKTRTVDLFQELRVPALRHAGDIYANVSRAQVRVHNTWYRVSDGPVRSRLAAKALFRYLAPGMHRLIDDYRPDAVVVTHPLLIADLFGLARAEFGSRFSLVSVVSDPMEVHASWAAPDLDECFVVSRAAAEIVRRLGLPHTRVTQVPFPVHKQFLTPLAKAEARAQLGLDPSGPIALIAGGGAGSGGMMRLVTALLDAGWPGMLLVAPGRNERLRSRLMDAKFIRALPQTGSLYTPMCASDVVITKAGPSSIFEAAAIGVPLVISRAVGRQESGNIELAERVAEARRWHSAAAQELADRARQRFDFPRCARPELADGASEIARRVVARASGADVHFPMSSVEGPLMYAP